ncbi:MAG: hypothetical protein ACI9BF_000679 [Candidatus Paceibacteria bacterium]|jgi:hypothetical protein
MTAEPEKQYSDFWDKLLPAYPISKGSMRLPIVSELIEIENFNHSEFQRNLLEILEDILNTQATKEKAIERVSDAGDDKLIPLIDSEYTGTVRFDCLWNPETKLVSILEINCDYPDGLLLHDKTYSALAETETSLHKDLFGKLFYENEDISVFHSPDAFFLDGYHAEADSLAELGHNVTRITDTWDIPHGTTIRRCLETSKLTDKYINELIRSKSRLINTIALRTLGYKNLLSYIEHSYIPKTIKVTHNNRSYCMEEKNNLVLKPTDGCEGYGIHFGNNINDIEWAKLIEDVVDKNYIAQQLVHIPKMTIPLYEDGTIIEKTLYYDLCPHFFIKKGEVIGAGHTLMRFSENKIVNVTQGGGIGYYKL